jgi:hypothetical protein
LQQNIGRGTVHRISTAVGVDELAIRAQHEVAAELQNVFAARRTPGPPASQQESQVAQHDARPKEPCPGSALQAELSVRLPGWVADKGEWQRLLAQERGQDFRPCLSHDQHLGPAPTELFIVPLHLTEVRQARNSGEVPQEDH